MSTGTCKQEEMGNKAKKKLLDEKRRPGRPKVLPPELDTRLAIRCSSADAEAWEQRATELGYVGASAWIRKVLNDALKHPAPAR